MQRVKSYNQHHARLRAPGERAFAQLKKWRILRQLRCSPHRATNITRAIHTLNTHETGCRVAGRNFPSRLPQIPA